MHHVLEEPDAVMHVASEASMNESQDQPPKNVNLMMLNMLQTMQKNQEASE
jgi:UDP-glucose 4-epimerase